MARMLPILNNPGTIRGSELLLTLSRAGYNGEDSLATLTDKIQLEIDEIIRCRPGGIVLIGWMVADPYIIKSLWFRTGVSETRILPEHFIRIPRPDVAEAIPGCADVNCGFLAFLPDIVCAARSGSRACPAPPQ